MGETKKKHRERKRKYRQITKEVNKSRAFVQSGCVSSSDSKCNSIFSIIIVFDLFK